ncbi:MAG TPA: hypothetical protein PLY09_06225 [Methanothrix sp.]|nr:hypothetical protein [Methanothrix sp.]
MIRFPDDIISIIFREMGLEDEALRFNQELFYSTIYRYFKLHPSLFADFYFIESGTYPYSDLLERIITRHKISRLLKTENPDFEFIRLKKGTSELIDRELKPNFDEGELEILKSIGKELQGKLSSV